jgi:xanthine dehydrogenase YagR molybdenum-binding subunit
MADTPESDMTFVDYPDRVLNAVGARRCGEVRVAAIAAAITAAGHATGVRVRNLPVRIDWLLKPPAHPTARMKTPSALAGRRKADHLRSVSV